MPNIDLDKLLEFWDKLGDLVWAGQVPGWWRQLLAAVIVVFLCGLALRWFKDVKKLWLEEFWPMFHKADERRRIRRRQSLAEHIQAQIDNIDRLDDWADVRFAELEAEVEADDEHEVFGFIPFVRRTTHGLRRVRSLARALETSRDRVILLQGPPGAGKSIAMRHVARSMSAYGRKSRNPRCALPVYVNLKELKRPADAPIDRALIQSYVLSSLSLASTSNIDEIVRDEFPKGIDEGTWFFLFDSFDELPDVLGSTEADVIIRKYREAIAELMLGYSRCRAVIASRHFRGPGLTGWPLFRIVRLNERRRRELIRNFDLDAAVEEELLGNLGAAGQDVRLEANVPMFLALLCEHVKAGHPFPTNIRSVFESHIGTRFERNAAWLWERFKLRPDEVRVQAERAAFAMSADGGLGLSPSRERLSESLTRVKLAADDDLERCLDALEYMKLARADTTSRPGESRQFTFVHRRFQEYFATSVLLADPERVTPGQLLDDARWRESAVVIAQTRSASDLAPLTAETRTRLALMLQDVANGGRGALVAEERANGSLLTSATENFAEFAWPAGALHLLGIIQEGFSRRLSDLPSDIRDAAGQLLLQATRLGTLGDKKDALDVAGVASEDVLVELLRTAFAHPSQWLRNAAYWQVANLAEIPDDVARGIRQALVGLYRENRLGVQQYATRAHLNRLDQPGRYLTIMRLLLFAPNLDLLIVVTVSCVWWATNVVNAADVLKVWQLYLPVLVLWMLFVHLTLRLSADRSSSFVVSLRLMTIGMLYLAVNPTVMVALSWDIFADFGREWLSVPSHVQAVLVLPIYVFLAYALVWPVTIPRAVLNTRALPVSAWVFMPLLAYPALRNAREFSTTVGAVAVMIPILGGIFWVVFVWFPSVLHDVAQFLGTMLMYGWIIFFCAFGLFALLTAAYWSFHDQRQWRKWERTSLRQISIAELLSTCASFHDIDRAVRVLSTVLDRELLAPTGENDQVLAGLAVAAELALHDRVTRNKPTREFSRWPSGLGDNAIRLVKSATPDFVDELYKLLKQTRTARSEQQAVA